MFCACEELVNLVYPAKLAPNSTSVIVGVVTQPFSRPLQYRLNEIDTHQPQFTNTEAGTRHH